MIVLTERLIGIFSMVPEWLVALISRIAIATVFWRSVQTKIEGWEIFGQNLKFWNITDSAFFLFQNEYTLPFLSGKIAAYLATFGEFFLSIGILIGLLTRFSAIGLLVMTAVIQLFIYPESWNVHILWAALLIYLIKHGGGAISMDFLLQKAL